MTRVERVAQVIGPTAATGTPVAIADLEAKFGWAKGGWEDKLLHAADAGKTGKISPRKTLLRKRRWTRPS